MSPVGSENGNSYVMLLEESTLVPYNVDSSDYGLRPSISLVSNIKILSGEGIATNPYKIVMN